MSFYHIFARFYEKAGRKMCRQCENFIPQKAKILDIGCGSGITSKIFKDFFRADLIGTDIKDQRVAQIPFEKIEGKNLPFSDNSFDVVLINYVLHHAADCSFILKEAKRIASDKIIIFEDLSEGLMSDFICRLHGLSYNYFFQKNGEIGKFLNEENWKKMFNGLNLKLVCEKKVSHILNPVTKKMFVLERV